MCSTETLYADSRYKSVKFYGRGSNFECNFFRCRCCLQPCIIFLFFFYFILNLLSIFDTFHFTMKSSSAKKSLVSVLFLIKIISQRGRVDYSLLLSFSLSHTHSRLRYFFRVAFRTIDCSSSSTFFRFVFGAHGYKYSQLEFWCAHI